MVGYAWWGMRGGGVRGGPCVGAAGVPSKACGSLTAWRESRSRAGRSARVVRSCRRRAATPPSPRVPGRAPQSRAATRPGADPPRAGCRAAAARARVRSRAALRRVRPCGRHAQCGRIRVGW
eukprot:2997881-Prymnesium_polylepis.1